MNESIVQTMETDKLLYSVQLQYPMKPTEVDYFDMIMEGTKMRTGVNVGRYERNIWMSSYLNNKNFFIYLIETSIKLIWIGL